MNSAEFNQRFDAAFEAATGDRAPAYPSADHRPSWERLQKKLSAQRRAKLTRSRLSKLAVLAAALMLGAFIFGNTMKVRAIEPFYSTLVETSSGMLTYFFGRAEDQDPSKAKTAPPPDFGQSDSYGLPMSRTVQTNAKEVGKLVAFAPPDFRYVPEGYSLDQVQVSYYGDHERANSATYIYANDTGNTIIFDFFKLFGNTGLAENQGSEGIKVERIALKDGSGILYTASNGSTRLETVVDGVRISLSGILPKEQFLEVYEEMKR
ncbi:DUF4367 domain-containing protein [Cohnella yongneupensis]|uniref:DUF4367 domain-containing protein n=1 Tax=Cohnella yongneupensis TaxID=425006 RepID=A0ABW0R2T7_9BACL